MYYRNGPYKTQTTANAEADGLLRLDDPGLKPVIGNFIKQLFSPVYFKVETK